MQLHHHDHTQTQPYPLPYPSQNTLGTIIICNLRIGTQMFPTYSIRHVLNPHEEISVLHVETTFLRSLFHYFRLPTLALVKADIFTHAFQ